MKNRFLIKGIVAFISTIIILTACKKINEATELGAGLIPAVDNVTTFDTSIQVNAYNELFTILNDSTRIINSDNHYLGVINTDPLFGKSNGSIFLELKPAVFPFAFENKPDSIKLDSVVLVLSYRSTYGDTNTLQKVNVFQMNQSNNFRRDSAYMIRENNFTYSTLLGSKTFAPNILDDSLSLYREKAKNQLRVKLNNSFGQSIINLDSATKLNTDSSFKTFHKGFAIIPDVSFGGRALMSFNLADTNTKLALYYSYQKNGIRDTTVRFFRVTSTSATANYIQRDYSGTPISSYQGGVLPDDQIFIQNTPGSFATIKIPALPGLSKRVIHRAELIMEQVYDPASELFKTPDILFLDAYDTAKKKFRTIPYDLILDNTGLPNYETFGMFGKKTIDQSGNQIKRWNFNLTRYVQNVLTGKEKYYDLRLSAPFFVFELIKDPNSGSDFEQFLFMNPDIVNGRVRLGGGNHATQKMKLRIIYSKL